mgnify:CR=1 FL=1
MLGLNLTHPRYLIDNVPLGKRHTDTCRGDFPKFKDWGLRVVMCKGGPREWSDEFAALWRRLTPEADMVTGFKISRSDPMHRIIIGRIYHHTVKFLFRLRVRDVDCDFRLMRRSIFNRVQLEKNTGVICLEMMRKIQSAGFQIGRAHV